MNEKMDYPVATVVLGLVIVVLGTAIFARGLANDLGPALMTLISVCSFVVVAFGATAVQMGVRDYGKDN